MADNVSSERRSATMKAVRSQNTSLELEIRRALWARGIRYRVNVRDLPGKPDIANKSLGLVIFVDSCFWHGCPEHGRIPKSHVDFWTAKISKNKQRDASITAQYQSMGWRIVRVWEHELESNLNKVVDSLVCIMRQCRDSES